MEYMSDCLYILIEWNYVEEGGGTHGADYSYSGEKEFKYAYSEDAVQAYLLKTIKDSGGNLGRENIHAKVFRVVEHLVHQHGEWYEREQVKVIDRDLTKQYMSHLKIGKK